MGFTGKIEKLPAQSNQGNLYDDRTISLEDFNCCIIFAVQRGKQAAIALNRAFTQLALIDFFRDAFGEQPLSIEEKRRLFYEAYAASISPEMWREMDREEILRLALLNDDSPYLDSNWNASNPALNDWDSIERW